VTVKNVKLAKGLLDKAEELINRMSCGSRAGAHQADEFVRHLHSEAYYARLDGRSARAITLNRLADKVARARNDLRCEEVA
jgi:hypothetical protein